jgi:hypothetical protein
MWPLPEYATVSVIVDICADKLASFEVLLHQSLVANLLEGDSDTCYALRGSLARACYSVSIECGW